MPTRKRTKKIIEPNFIITLGKNAILLNSENIFVIFFKKIEYTTPDHLFLNTNRISNQASISLYVNIK